MSGFQQNDDDSVQCFTLQNTTKSLLEGHSALSALNKEKTDFAISDTFSAHEVENHPARDVLVAFSQQDSFDQESLTSLLAKLSPESSLAFREKISTSIYNSFGPETEDSSQMGNVDAIFDHTLAILLDDNGATYDNEEFKVDHLGVRAILCASFLLAYNTHKGSVEDLHENYTENACIPHALLTHNSDVLSMLTQEAHDEEMADEAHDRQSQHDLDDDGKPAKRNKKAPDEIDHQMRDPANKPPAKRQSSLNAMFGTSPAAQTKPPAHPFRAPPSEEMHDDDDDDDDTTSREPAHASKPALTPGLAAAAARKSDAHPDKPPDTDNLDHTWHTVHRSKGPVAGGRAPVSPVSVTAGPVVAAQTRRLMTAANLPVPLKTTDYPSRCPKSGGLSYKYGDDHKEVINSLMVDMGEVKCRGGNHLNSKNLLKYPQTSDDKLEPGTHMHYRLTGLAMNTTISRLRAWWGTLTGDPDSLVRRITRRNETKTDPWLIVAKYGSGAIVDYTGVGGMPTPQLDGKDITIEWQPKRAVELKHEHHRHVVNVTGLTARLDRSTEVPTIAQQLIDSTWPDSERPSFQLGPYRSATGSLDLHFRERKHAEFFIAHPPSEGGLPLRLFDSPTTAADQYTPELRTLAITVPGGGEGELTDQMLQLLIVDLLQAHYPGGFKGLLVTVITPVPHKEGNDRPFRVTFAAKHQPALALGCKWDLSFLHDGRVSHLQLTVRKWDTARSRSKSKGRLSQSNQTRAASAKPKPQTHSRSVSPARRKGGAVAAAANSRGRSPPSNASPAPSRLSLPEILSGILNSPNGDKGALVDALILTMGIKGLNNRIANHDPSKFAPALTQAYQRLRDDIITKPRKGRRNRKANTTAVSSPSPPPKKGGGVGRGRGRGKGKGQDADKPQARSKSASAPRGASSSAPHTRFAARAEAPSDWERASERPSRPDSGTPSGPRLDPSWGTPFDSLADSLEATQLLERAEFDRQSKLRQDAEELEFLRNQFAQRQAVDSQKNGWGGAPAMS